jgi:hypothetical protein
MAALSSKWLADAPEGDDFVGSHGRLFDVIVLGRVPRRKARGWVPLNPLCLKVVDLF